MREYEQLTTYIINDESIFVDKIEYGERGYKGVLSKDGEPEEVEQKKTISDFEKSVYDITELKEMIPYDKDEEGYEGVLIKTNDNIKVEEKEKIKTFSKTKTNIATAIYSADGELIQVHYSWDNSNDHPNLHIDEDGYEGYIDKDGNGRIVSGPDNIPLSGGGYKIVTVWEADYSGKLTKYETLYTALYYGVVVKSTYRQKYSAWCHTKEYFDRYIAKHDNQEHVADPINIVTGNFYINETDMLINTIGPELSIIRYYNSKVENVSSLGMAWRLNFESSLIDEGNGEISVTYPDGHIIVFRLDQDKFVSKFNNDILYKETDGSYRLVLKKLRHTYYYSTDGKLVSICDDNNNCIAIEYTDSKLNRVTTSCGQFLTFEYVGDRVSLITDVDGRQIQYKYDSQGRLIEVIKLSSGSIKYTYEDNRIRTIVDEHGIKYLENMYDKFGRVVKQLDFNGEITTIEYHEHEMYNVVTNHSTGFTKMYYYDKHLRVTKLQYSDGNYEEYTYDEYDNRNSIRDKRGNITELEYDDRGNLLKVTSPSPFNYVTIYTYNDDDRLIRCDFPNGRIKTYEYDISGNLTKTIESIDETNDKVITLEYNDNGKLVSKVDAEDNTESYEYDDCGNLIKVIDPEGITIEFEHDNLNRIIELRKMGGVTKYSYDNMDNVIKIIDSNSNITRYKYDLRGDVIKVIRPEQYDINTDDGLGIEYEYDGMNRLTASTDALGNTRSFFYDQNGNKIKNVEPIHNTGNISSDIGLSYIYDAHNRLSKIVDQMDGITRIKYDASGNRIKVITPNNYDAAIDDGDAYIHLYDEMDRLHQVKDKDNNLIKEYHYNELGKVVKEIDNRGYKSGNNTESRYGIIYKYNLLGQVIEKRVPLVLDNGSIKYSIVRFSYDKNGRLIDERKSDEYVTLSSDPSRWVVINSHYYKNGKIKTIQDSLGSIITYDYDEYGYLINESKKINDDKYHIKGYEYDTKGRIKSRWNKVENVDLGINKEGIRKLKTTFEYDKNDNVIKEITPNKHITDYRYDSSDRLIEKTKHVTVDSISGNKSGIYFNTDAMYIYPNKEYEFRLVIVPDNEITGGYIEIDYDSSVFTILDIDSKFEKMKVNTAIGDKISIKLDECSIDKETELLSIKIQTKDSGFGVLELNPYSYFIDSDGRNSKFAYSENGLVFIQTPDLDNNGIVDIKDLGIASRQYKTIDPEPSYNPLHDIDGNGEIGSYELNYIKDFIIQNKSFSGNVKTASQTYIKDDYTIEQHKQTRVTKYSYDKNGKLAQITDCNGNSINYMYDSLSRVVSITDKEGGVQGFIYDREDNVTKIISPENYMTGGKSDKGISYQYDYVNRKEKVLDTADNCILKFEYDINSNLIKEIDYRGQEDNKGIEYSYDIGNRLVKIHSVQSKEKSKAKSVYEYDATSKLISLIDGNGNKEKYNRDLWGRIINVIDPLGNIASFNYDYAGNIVKTVDQNGNVTMYKYNSINKLLEVIDAQKRTIKYSYDHESRLVKSTSRTGDITHYKYNEDNKITMRFKDLNRLERYFYNLDGSLNSTLNESGIEEYHYSKNGNITSKYVNGLNDISYSYNMDGRIKSITSSTCSMVNYNYDDMGRVNKILKGNDLVIGYGYNMDGSIKEVLYGENLRAAYDYNRDGQIESISLLKNNNLIKNNTYAYDGNDNLLMDVLNTDATLYDYDKNNRLTRIDYSSGDSSLFKYDPAGNRVEKLENNHITTYAYNELNQLILMNYNGDVNDFEYDLNGNLIKESNEQIIYKYDDFNRLTTMYHPDKGYQKNKYNSLNHRMESEVNGIVKKFAINSDRVIAESVNNKKSIFIGQNSIHGKITNDNSYFYINNAHNDVTDILDHDGVLLNSYSYTPFGKYKKSFELINNDFKYSGEQYDYLMDCYYLRSRYYKPSIGRFIQEDTYRDDGVNLYSYVANNPLKYVDPSGFEKESANNRVRYQGGGRIEYRYDNPEVVGRGATVTLSIGSVSVSISVLFYDESMISRDYTNNYNRGKIKNRDIDNVAGHDIDYSKPFIYFTMSGDLLPEDILKKGALKTIENLQTEIFQSIKKKKTISLDGDIQIAYTTITKEKDFEDFTPDTISGPATSLGVSIHRFRASYSSSENGQVKMINVGVGLKNDYDISAEISNTSLISKERTDNALSLKDNYSEPKYTRGARFIR